MRQNPLNRDSEKKFSDGEILDSEIAPDPFIITPNNNAPLDFTALLESVEKIKLPPHPEGEITADKDDWAFKLTLNTPFFCSTIKEQIETNFANFQARLTANGSGKGDLPAADLNPRCKAKILDEAYDSQSHPFLIFYYSIAQSIANATKIDEIRPAKDNREVLINLFTWNTQDSSMSFTNSDDANKSLHTDHTKDPDVFYFTIALFIAGNYYNGKKDGKRMFFPKENFNNNTECTFISPIAKKLVAVIFPSYALHGTETWHLEAYHRAAATIQRWWRRNSKQEKAKPVTDNTRKNTAANESHQLLLDSSLPWRASFVYQVQATRSGSNSGQIAESIEKYLNTLPKCN